MNFIVGGIWGLLDPTELLNLGSWKCHFLRLPQDSFGKINRKENAAVNCLFYPSLVLWNNKKIMINEIPTQRHQYNEKNLSVIPI